MCSSLHGETLQRRFDTVGVVAPVRVESLPDVRRALRAHVVGNDPTTRLGDNEFWRATITPDGPGTLHLRWGSSALDAEAFGPGAAWLLARAGDFAGLGDSGFVFGPDSHRIILDAQRRHPGLRLSNGHCVYHSILPVIIGQRVTAIEAHRSWRRLCLQIGAPAPGPCELRLPPEPSDLANRPYWWFHPLGIDKQRADALRQAARHARHLFAVDDSTPAEARQRLSAVPGIGPWTIGATLGHALGDTDAVAVGDYHLKNYVAYALAGEPRATDERMLELLAPYAGQRARVLALLATTGITAPKYGARQRILPMERW